MQLLANIFKKKTGNYFNGNNVNSHGPTRKLITEQNQ